MQTYFKLSFFLCLVMTTSFAQQKPGLRAHHELVYDEKSAAIVLVGGSTPLDGGNSFEMYDDVWHYDGIAWKQIANTGDRRSGIKMAYDSKRSRLFSYGGWIDGISLSDLRVLEHGQWKIISSLPEMKATEGGFVYDAARDKCSSERGVVNTETWEWDGRSWKRFEGKGPQGRQAFAMVYDGNRKRTILFGGGDGSRNQFADIWEFDGTKWDSIQFTANSPGPRIAPGYAFDSKRRLLIIFGGISAGQIKGDLWSWNGKEWKQLSDAGPAPRAMGYMAYDKKRDRIVLFGGRKGWPDDANDTWEWDGKAWKELR